jgi:AbrB family looped-hinge helix DNA binding protein
MSRITQKGQVTIPKEIRDRLGIRPNDIGEFTIKENSVIFTVKKGTLLDAHKKKTGKRFDIHKTRELMEQEIARNAIEGTE